MLLAGSRESFLRLQLFSDFGEDVVIAPGGWGIGLLVVIRLEDKITGRKKDLFHVRVLSDFFPRRGDDQPVVFAWLFGPVFELLAFKSHPVDAHFLHVLFGERAG